MVGGCARSDIRLAVRVAHVGLAIRSGCRPVRAPPEGRPIPVRCCHATRACSSVRPAAEVLRVDEAIGGGVLLTPIRRAAGGRARDRGLRRLIAGTAIGEARRDVLVRRRGEPAARRSPAESSGAGGLRLRHLRRVAGGGVAPVGTGASVSAILPADGPRRERPGGGPASGRRSGNRASGAGRPSAPGSLAGQRAAQVAHPPARLERNAPPLSWMWCRMNTRGSRLLSTGRCRRCRTVAGRLQRFQTVSTRCCQSGCSLPMTTSRRWRGLVVSRRVQRGEHQPAPNARPA